MTFSTIKSLSFIKSNIKLSGNKSTYIMKLFALTFQNNIKNKWKMNIKILQIMIYDKFLKNYDNHLTVVFYILINCVEFCTDKYGYILLKHVQSFSKQLVLHFHIISFDKTSVYVLECTLKKAFVTFHGKCETLLLIVLTIHGKVSSIL